MLFNSTAFFGFFFAVYVLYLPLFRSRAQTWLLLVSSYAFYAFWDWRFLSLILFSTLVDHQVALRMDAEPDPRGRKRLLLVSLVVNLGTLGFFKYCNFFIDSAVEVFRVAGLPVEPVHLQVVLPVGISFYTFQTLSYTIDVYRKELKPTRDLLVFATYVAFFPQLVAGPIERASRLLPQIAEPRPIRFEQLRDGAWLVFFGLFKKVAVADNLAPLVDPVFSGDAPVGAAITWIGVYAFAFQIYCDFSGYTDIARGIAKWLGVELALNFRRPYFATNPSDFWRRWHISLSQWLRDYLYIPLGGNRAGRWGTYRNMFLTMLLGGLWHGATWMFVVWGAFHGGLLIAHRLWTDLWPADKLPAARAALWPVRVFALFHLVCIAWVFFRAETLAQAVGVFSQLTTSWSLDDAAWSALGLGLLTVAPLLLVDAWAELWSRIHPQDDFDYSGSFFAFAAGKFAALTGVSRGGNRHLRRWEQAPTPKMAPPFVDSELGFLLAAPAPLRGTVYAGLAAILVIAGAPSGRAFLYFQF